MGWARRRGCSPPSSTQSLNRGVVWQRIPVKEPGGVGGGGGGGGRLSPSLQVMVIYILFRRSEYAYPYSRMVDLYWI
jgi:hypothetical protein